MPDKTGKNPPPRPVVFGEVLFDCFPDGSNVLGGAPFNVAWHLQGFGLSPLMISAIGDDPLGRRILDAMTAWGMATDGIQVIEDLPTGTVNILQDGETHAFEIPADQAYDRIGAEAVDAVSDIDVSILYHGSLALRSRTSCETLGDIRDSMKRPVFLDVNLRAPWWAPTTVNDFIDASRWLKLNDEELLELSGRPAADRGNAAAMMYDRGLAMLILTRGENGAMILTDDGRVVETTGVGSDVVDTVGAGDAFSSVCIVGMVSGWGPDLILERASAFASRICGIKGAVSDRKDLYRETLEDWRLEHEQGIRS